MSTVSTVQISTSSCKTFLSSFRQGHWRRGQEGELDETRLVDALAGEANVFRLVGSN